MNTKKDTTKLRGTILFFLIVIAICAILFNTLLCHNQKFGEPVVAESKITVAKNASAPRNNKVKIPLSNEFVKISSISKDYKYVLYESKPNSSQIVVNTVSREEFEQFYEDTPYLSMFTNLNEGGTVIHYKEENMMDYYEMDAVAIIKNLTKSTYESRYADPDHKDTIITYNHTPYDISAFPGLFNGQSSKVEDTVLFEINNISLDISNVELKKIIGSKELAEMGGSVAAVVEADVTTIYNDGRFKDLAWIPAEGETERIDFVVTFKSVSYETSPDFPNICLVNDIGILNTTPAMAIEKLPDILEKIFR